MKRRNFLKALLDLVPISLAAKFSSAAKFDSGPGWGTGPYIDREGRVINFRTWSKSDFEPMEVVWATQKSRHEIWWAYPKGNR